MSGVGWDHESRPSASGRWCVCLQGVGIEVGCLHSPGSVVVLLLLMLATSLGSEQRKMPRKPVKTSELLIEQVSLK